MSPTSVKLGAGALTLVFLFVVFQSCFSGGDGGTVPSVSRPGSIPTATPPAQLPEPLLLGETRGTSTSGTAPAAGSANTYTVKSGDTLGGIAASLGVPAEQQAAWVTEVLRLNSIADARLLASGVLLRLPNVPTPTPTPRATGTPAPAATPATGGTATPTRTPGTAATTPTPVAQAPTATRVPVTGGAGTYTVVSGDNPSVIADKLGIPANQQAVWVNDLVALNGINPSNLQVGQILQLPSGTAPQPTATRVP